MIPKIIHYCWFGKGIMPKSQKNCIKSWEKLMPDWQFMRWDEQTFDYRRYPASRFAYEVKKYALVSDVCRYNALSQYGGVYLDTDVELFQPLTPFLDNNFFSGIEYYREFELEHIAEQYLDSEGSPLHPGEDIPHLEILTSSMGCCPQHEMICRIRDYYNSVPCSPDLALNYRQWVNNDRLVARYLTDYGFRYIDRTQHLDDGIVIYGTGTFGYAFCPNPDYTVSFHHNAASWDSEHFTQSHRRHLFFDRIGLLPLYRLAKKMKHVIFRNSSHNA